MRSLVLAAFVFSHNLLALIGAVLLAIYLLWRGLFVDAPKRWVYDLFSIGLAVALTAVFWLPFIAERNAIRLDVAGPGHFDYHNHFIPLSMLLSQSPALDMGATTPKYIYNLGLVQWLLLIPAAILAVLRRKSKSGKIALFFVLTTLLVVFLITPLAAFLWDLVPPAAFVQLPWRLPGPAAFTLAMSLGVLFRAKPAEQRTSPRNAYDVLRNTLFPVLAFLALLVSALPTMYPPLWGASFGLITSQPPETVAYPEFCGDAGEYCREAGLEVWSEIQDDAAAFHDSSSAIVSRWLKHSKAY